MATKMQRFGNNQLGFIRINKKKTLGDAMSQLERIRQRGGERAERIAKVIDGKTSNYKRRVESISNSRNYYKAEKKFPYNGTHGSVYARMGYQSDLNEQSANRALERRMNDPIERANQVMRTTVSG